MLNDHFMLMKVYNIIGHVYLNYKIAKKAVASFKKLKDLAAIESNDDVKMFAYKQMGISY